MTSDQPADVFEAIHPGNATARCVHSVAIDVDGEVPTLTHAPRSRRLPA